MNKEELYKLAINNVNRYSLLNEIFAIRDKRVEIVDYTIGVNGFISLDVLKRYVRNINELVEYQNIGTIKKLKELQERINKAIEFIHGTEYQYGDLEQDSYDYNMCFNEVEDLLKILKGED